MGKLIAFLLGVFVFCYLMIVALLAILKNPEIDVVKYNTTFGQIEKPNFGYIKGKNKYKFILDTIDGNYPNTTMSAHIYFMPEKKTTLAYLTRAESVAEYFGFDDIESERVNEGIIKFEDDHQVLDFDVKDYHFNYQLKFSSLFEELIEATPEANFTLYEDNFTDTAREVLQEVYSYPPFLAAGKSNIVYMKYDNLNKSFIPISSGEVPQAVRIDFFRKDEELPVVPPKYFESQNYVVLAPLSRYPELIEAQYRGFDKLDTEPGVYPLISSTEAWKALDKGKAKVISVDSDVETPIKIKDIFLAYYDPPQYQKYFQPVFVFLGDKNFVAYLEAVRPEYFVTD
jgi:hypothetical protein